MIAPKHHTDIIQTGWVGKMPSVLRPYLYLMRLDRPIGTWLLLMPALWVIAMNGADLYLMVLFAIGALVMRGAGCVINDLWDRDLDGRVERTAMRPIPSGDVSVLQALLFLCVLLIIGLIILLQLSLLAITLGVISVFFIAIYPLMKRITWWPQAFLGLTFNFGALMGWAAATGDLPWQAWAIYAAGCFWTLGYDTIYALQDRDDDALIGIKSTARLFVERMGMNPAIPCGVFFCIHYALVCLVIMNDHSMNTLAIMLLCLPVFHLLWQVITLKPSLHDNTLARFKSNRDYALLLLGVIMILYL
jgi:4-hydroxybenzoate polyprenyltransferase